MAKFVCNVISYTLRRTVDITVIVPTPTIPESMGMGLAEGEKPSHTPKAPYPVLYLLHGTGNNHATWSGYTKIELYAEEHQIAVVNMSAENLDYVTYEGRDDFFRFMSEELPDFVTGIFPISKKPEDTYIAGLSMGGYGTLVHALNFPERFCAFGALSAGIGLCPKDLEHFDPKDEPAPMGGLTRPARGRKPETNPYSLARKLAAEGTKFPKGYICCGTKDGGYETNKEYCGMLKELGADVTWDEIDGMAHEWRFWDIEIERFLNWIPRTDIYAQKGKRKV